MLRLLLIAMLLLSPVINASNVSVAGHVSAKQVDSVTALATLPFATAQQVYVFKNGYAACNGSLAVISYGDKTLTLNASKLLYLPKHKMLLFYNVTGLYKVLLPTLEIIKIFSGALDGFWVSVGQNIIYAWCCYNLRAIDFSGLIRATYTFDWQIKYVIPYGYDYWLLVVTSNGTLWKEYIFSDGRKFTLQYTREREITSDGFFIDWGGDKTLIYANTTHLIYWRTYYDTETVYELPVALSAVNLFQAISYWSYSVVLADDDTVIVFTRGTFYTYSFSGGISYAKTYIGMRTWGADYPWIVVASDDGIRVIYIDPDTGDWTAQNIYTSPVHSDVYIDDLDLDGAEEFYFVNTQGQLVRVEIEQVKYWYSYRAVIPNLYFWAGKFLVYDRSANDWDGDKLSNGRETNELRTSIIRSDTDNDGLTDYEEVYITGTDPLLTDTDGDGIPDGAENVTDPTKPDTDGDGILDGRELELGTNPLGPDTDKDGLPDGEEVKLGTNPLKADTDGDGLPDGDEVKHGTDPLKADTDGDGLTDFEELHTYYTNPNDPDTDNDGLSDYDEVKVYGTNPLNPDTDGDKVDDGVEVKLGFDPLDPRNNPKSAWYVVKTFWWAFAGVFLTGIGIGMLAVLIPLIFHIKIVKKKLRSA